MMAADDASGLPLYFEREQIRVLRVGPLFFASIAYYVETIADGVVGMHFRLTQETALQEPIRRRDPTHFAKRLAIDKSNLERTPSKNRERPAFIEHGNGLAIRNWNRPFERHLPL